LNSRLPSSRILTLVFTDVVDSTAMKTRQGDQRAGELITRHRELVSTLATATTGRIIDWAGDGCFLTFETPTAAVTFALQLQQANALQPDLPEVRTGIHMGEVTESPGPDGDGGPARIEGLAVDLAARISGVARPGQILMSSAVADSARQRLDITPFQQAIRWHAHGDYTLKGFDEVLQIREVGLEGVANFEPPTASEKAQPARPVVSRSPGKRMVAATLSVVILGGAVAGLLKFGSADRSTPETVSTPEATSTKKELTVPGFGDRPAIAVLPFDNLSGDPEQEYFADGLAEDLITRLSLFRIFPVIARNSSFVFKGKAVDLKAISADLGVGYVVEGSMRQAGNRVRITAQLIDATTDQHVWAETYDRELTDVFAIQDEISAAIAASMVGDLQRAEQIRATRRAPESLEAWGLYQRADPLVRRFTAEDSAQARDLLKQSIALDPQFAPARSLLSEALVWEVIFGWSETPSETLNEALAESRRAAAIDAREPTAYISEAFALAYLGDIDEAVTQARKAVELNPSAPLALQYTSYVQVMAGHPPEESIALVERAMRLSPHDPIEFFFYDSLGIAYFCAGRYDEGVAASRRLVALRPTYVLGYIYGAMNAAEFGNLSAAREFIGQARAMQPDLSFESAHQALGGMAPDVDRRMSAALRKAGLE
jgi:adenylate cyclase